MREKMKHLIKSLALISMLFVGGLAFALPNPLCQAKLLKVGADALNAHAPGSLKGVFEFREVSFNYGLEGRPRIVLLGRRMSDSSRVCLVQVYTTVQGNDADGCQNYVFESIDSTCE